MGVLIRAFDWSQTPIGPVEKWPQNLRTAVRIMLDAPFPMHIAWGDDFIQLYNDGYRPVLGETKHPAALGAPIRESFPEIWDDFLGPKFADVQQGIPYGAEDLPVFLHRNGYLEECYFTFSYSPLRDENDVVQGVVTMETETTERFIRERRLRTLQDMAAGFTAISTSQQVLDRLQMALQANVYDVPFALYYSINADTQTTQIAATVGLTDHIVVEKSVTQQLAEVIRTGLPQLITDLTDHVVLSVDGAWPEPVREAYILPVIQIGKDLPHGVLVFGVNPRKAFDADQQAFFESLSQHTANTLATVASIEAERARNEVELELERAKATVHQETNAQLSNLLMQAPVAIAIFRGPKHVIELVNDAHLELWGRTYEQVINKPLFEAIPESVGQGYEELLANVLTTGEPFYANELYADLVRDGKLERVYFNFVFRALRELDGTITGVIVVANEITEQVKDRRKVEESEARLSLALAASQMGTWDMNILTDTSIRSLRHDQIFGYDIPLVNWTSEHLFAHIADADKALAQQAFEQAYATSRLFMQLRIVRPDQSLRWIKVDGQVFYDAEQKPVRMLGTILDITEQHIAEMSLRESEKRFRTLLETISQMTWTNLPTGEVNFYNQRWYNYTGLNYEQTKAWGWQAVVHPDDLPHTLANYKRALALGEPFVFENRYRRGADNQYRWHLNKALPIRDEQGTITIWVGTATDIHDQKTENERLENLVAHRTQELSISNANLERSNFDLMQFASVASHDLKEPLRKIQAFGSLLQSTAEKKLDDTERGYFQRIISATNRMQNLVDDVLNLSKLSHQAITYSETDLAVVVHRIIDDLEVFISEKGAHIVIESLPKIRANAGQMHQLFQNLIINALKFNTSQTPTVLIGQVQVPITAEKAVGLGIQPDNYVTIRVSDNGIGFDQAYAEKIFGVFQRLHGTKYGGTGIGLAICKKIVDNHHGSIKVDSKPNQGATFEITLPVKQA